MKERVSEHVERVFRPEFLNRLDDVIIFRHLTTDDLKDVIDMELASVRARLADRGYRLRLTDDAKEFLIKEGCKNIDYGARPLRRAIEGRVEDPLSEELLRGEFQGKDEIVVEAVWDQNHEKILHLKFEGRMADDSGEPVAASAGAPPAAGQSRTV
jgi:ATP-dependent Clp protease ATP-binding subunit ClpC